MKDNISMIFATIIGVLLIVILPLISVLDRQDSMSYNVVLTETTKFVDNIRNNGFIDKKSYDNYISALASTSNTYKIDMEIYRRRLIRDIDSNEDTYIEEVELFNTKDVLDVIQKDLPVDEAANSNEKNNVYLLNQNDEVYFKVYNTNITSGSIIYRAFAGTSTDKFIDISYGGIVNNVNWELFSKINASSINMPEVLMEVPVNARNQTNIMKITEDNILEEVDCDMFYDLCQDGATLSQAEQYTYLYDLTYTENTQATIAVELKNMESIVIGENRDGSLKYAKLESLTEQDFNNAKNYIKQNFIQLNEMFAKVDLEYRGKTDRYYTFNIVLKDIEIAVPDLLSVFASVSVLPGLGQDADGVLSPGAESVKIELVDQAAVDTVSISAPINWNKLIATRSITDSLMRNKEVYVDLDIAFIISYTGVDEIEDIKTAIKQNLSVSSAEYTGLEILTADELKERYNVAINTRTISHAIIKFKYTAPNTAENDNYIKLDASWVPTEDEQEPDLAYGAESSTYAILEDNIGPTLPSFHIDGVIGNNGWYIKENVNITVIGSSRDMIYKDGRQQLGGSGVQKNTLTLTGKNILSETKNLRYVIQKEGTTTAIGYAYDYLGNKSEKSEIKIKLDKTNPTSPKITIRGTEGKQGWHTSNVTLNITAGTDSISGVERTTYKVSGAQRVSERPLPASGVVNITTNGISTVTVTTYDKAGNSTSKVLEVKIDKTTPSGARLQVISGSKNSYDWYNTDVVVRLLSLGADSPSGKGKIQYQIIDSVNKKVINTVNVVGDRTDILIDKSGKYTIKAYSYNAAGNITTDSIDINIDKDNPNLPSVSLNSDKEINNGWYKSNVQVTMTSNLDVGPAGEQSFSYIATKDGVAGTRTETTSPSTITLKADGIYFYDIYSLDYASNESKLRQEIKIDRTSPVSASFLLNGKKGLNGWYTSDVEISYEGGSDKTSGIKDITLSETKLTNDTDGTTVTLTTTDNAGNSVTKSSTIKIDKTIPTSPVINLPQVTGKGIAGVNLYNKNVDIIFTPGTDANLDKTTYKVINTETGAELVKETNVTNYTLTSNGLYEVVTFTYDKAGNSSSAYTLVWLNKNKPESPQISKINGKTSQRVTGNSATFNVEFSNVEAGNIINITLVKDGSYETKTTQVRATGTTQLATIQVDSKGRYTITATQTNVFGTESDVNTKKYEYEYN